jgi:hypothetical protein
MLKFDIPKEDRKTFIDLFLLKPERRNAFLEIIRKPEKVPNARDFVSILLML